jgi:LPXTG-motif cell wall-anchored protein
VRKHWAALAATTALLIGFSATPALAHEGNPDFRSVIDRVTPNVPGVSFEVLSYDSYFQLLDQHGHEVVIYGYENEPYARVLKDGTVQVNERSPAYYLNDTRFPTAEVPPAADPKAPPKWKTVDDSGTFIWHDHRMHYQSTSTPPQVTDTSRKTKIFDYEVPLRIDGRKGAIDGTLYWVGPADTSKLPFIVAGAVIVLAGGALVLFVRRRRREDEDGDDGAKPGDEPAKEAW